MNQKTRKDPIRTADVDDVDLKHLLWKVIEGNQRIEALLTQMRETGEQEKEEYEAWLETLVKQQEKFDAQMAEMKKLEAQVEAEMASVDQDVSHE